MKIKEPENANYAAVVVKIKNLVDLEGCDNVVGTPLLGFQAIVNKNTKVGDIGIVFSPETQLSEEFARLNNLHRHSNLNDNEGVSGYLEDNRRIKAVRFRGHKSNCLFMPLSSLSYIKKNDLNELKEGDTFDKLGDHDICQKFILKQRKTGGAGVLEKNKLKFIRVEEAFMPKHYSTDNYFRNEHLINDKERIIVTQKLHGTSIRIGHTLVKQKPRVIERIAKSFGVRVQETIYDYVYGSKNVIKDINNPNQNHYYSTDVYTEEGKKLEGLLPQGYVAYGELIGWTSLGSPIQKNYTYNLPSPSCELYVYRIAHINPQGRLVDLSWVQVKEFCNDIGLKYVPELWIGRKNEFIADNFLDKRFKDEGYDNAVQLEKDKNLVDEGVCVRVEGLAPYILKAKSPVFYEMESANIDQEVPDMEEDQS